MINGGSEKGGIKCRLIFKKGEVEGLTIGWFTRGSANAGSNGR